METEFYIKSTLFPSYPNEEEEINPGRFGKRLAEFVKAVLEENGIQVADLYSTDYSFELRIDQFDFSVFIQTGNMDGEENEFLISVEPKKEFVRKWFRKIPTSGVIKTISTPIIEACEKNEEIEIIKKSSNYI